MVTTYAISGVKTLHKLAKPREANASISTIVVIYNATNGWNWPAFNVGLLFDSPYNRDCDCPQPKVWRQ
ncbi:hypothetical protein ACVKSY_000412 [Sphingomonas sp. PvP107]